MNVKIRRLIATYIDFIIIAWPTCYLGNYLNPMFETNLILYIILSMIILIIGFNIFLRKDTIFGYRSIGKKITRLKIYDMDGSEIKDKKKLIDRIFQSLSTAHLYPFMILINNKSNGDKRIGTEVK